MYMKCLMSSARFTKSEESVCRFATMLATEPIMVAFTVTPRIINMKAYRVSYEVAGTTSPMTTTTRVGKAQLKLLKYCSPGFPPSKPTLLSSICF